MGELCLVFCLLVFSFRESEVLRVTGYGLWAEIPDPRNQIINIVIFNLKYLMIILKLNI